MNKFEEYKKIKHPLTVIDDIYRYAETGFDSIEEEHFNLFKWYGVYQQRPKDGYFMMRIKVPGGRITAPQAREVAAIATKYGRGLIDITTRQTFQYHWLKIEDMPDIFARLESVGLTSAGACGDIARNITSCPVAGLAHDELFDVRPTVNKLQDFFHNNKDFANLPRKYKIAVVACPVHCALPQINDFSLIGAKNEAGANGFHYYVGGGLSTQPHISQNVGIWLPEEQVIDGARVVSEIYRDALELREKRTHARLKFLVADKGIEWFRDEFIKRLGWTPEPATNIHLPDDTFRDHVGVTAQKQEGLNWIGLCVLTGRIDDEKLIRAADIADEYGSGDLCLTNVQNMIVPNVPTEKLEGAKTALAAAGYEWDVPNIRRGAMACTGIEFCNLALTETKLRMKDIIAYLETKVETDRGIKINMNGCPNSCAQHHVGDIGLQGCVAKLADGSKVEAYDIHLGGQLGADARFTRAIHRKVPADNVKYAIENVIKSYYSTRTPDERFAVWAHRHTNEELDAFLGVPTIVGAPDLPASAKEAVPA
ncbi:MAG TPA: nitrite/sulfite reductase [Capsulimonadaceae bacterium]|jgi:sulfite reductase beta subunit-like hemoprotein